MSAINEEFDSEGNVVKVGDLSFVEGILGTGAYGTVRLARRKPPTSPAPQDQSHKRIRRDQEYARKKSVSAPSDFDFFPKPQRRKPKSIDETPIVGNLGLFTWTSSRLEDSADQDQLVAVKIFQKSILKRMRTMTRDSTTHRLKVHTALETVEREIALMKQLHHPNLVTLYEVIDSPESDMLYMVIEYMPLGEILTYQDDGTFRRKNTQSGQRTLRGLVNGHFDEENSALYFVDILHGLAYLHRHHICHRDLKPENIL